MDEKFLTSVSHSIIESGLMKESPLNSYHTVLCSKFVEIISYAEPNVENAKKVLREIFDGMFQKYNEDDIDKAYQLAADFHTHTLAFK